MEIYVYAIQKQNMQSSDNCVFHLIPGGIGCSICINKTLCYKIYCLYNSGFELYLLKL